MTKDEVKKWQDKAKELFDKAGIVITDKEQTEVEIADFRLNEYEQTGLAVLVYVNTDRCCAKELAMLPHQTCPEHRHPPVSDYIGKEETFRCRWGRVYLYVDGEKTPSPKCKPPTGREDTYTAWHEVILNPGDQYTLYPETLHWFQAGDEGAVVSEFSTRSLDEHDIFTDQQIQRATEIVD